MISENKSFSFLALNPFGSGLQAAVEKTSILSSASELKITEIKCGFIRGGSGFFVKIYTNQDIWGCGKGLDATPHLSSGQTFEVLKLI